MGETILMNISEYKYRTELHAHTNPASACSNFTPEEVIKRYADIGFDSIVISNHFYPGSPFRDDKKKCIEEYLRDYQQAIEEGNKAGINVIFGCELRFEENFNDYLIFGIDPEFLDFAYDSMPDGIAEFSSRFRSESTLIIQAHPFRDGAVPMPAEYLDGVEAFNLHPGHNSRVAVAAKYAKENDLIVTGGTDFHHEGHQGMTALLTKELMKTSHDVARVLKSRDYLIEIGGAIVMPYGNL